MSSAGHAISQQNLKYRDGYRPETYNYYVIVIIGIVAVRVFASVVALSCKFLKSSLYVDLGYKLYLF